MIDSCVVVWIFYGTHFKMKQLLILSINVRGPNAWYNSNRKWYLSSLLKTTVHSHHEDLVKQGGIPLKFRHFCQSASFDGNLLLGG